MQNLVILPIIPKCIGCVNVVMEGPVEMLSESTCRVFAGPKHRFDDKANCLHASHLTTETKKKKAMLNPIKASKRRNG